MTSYQNLCLMRSLQINEIEFNNETEFDNNVDQIQKSGPQKHCTFPGFYVVKMRQLTAKEVL